MDSRSFDRFTRSLAAPKSRRGVLAGLAAIVAGARAAGAQVTQAQCGNKTCRNNPGRCADGCVCCVYANGNARCRPPGTCGSGTEVSPCQAAPNGGPCGANADCCSGICQVGTCVATVAGTCAAGADYCADPSDANKCGDGQCTCLPTESDGTICGITLCEACASDADCAGTFGFAVEFRCVSSIEGGCCDQVASYCAYLCPPQSCFTGETLVAMADGTTQPIAMVERGDLVLGQTGVNRVEAIERPLLGARPLYAAQRRRVLRHIRAPVPDGRGLEGDRPGRHGGGEPAPRRRPPPGRRPASGAGGCHGSCPRRRR